MAIRRKKKQEEETLVDIVEARDSATDFLESNQKTIMGGLLALILLVGAYLAYKYMYKAPREKEASTMMFQAQAQFEKDSFALALTNPGNGGMGFGDIISTYGGTKAANLAKYYSGVSYLQLGQYDAAIDFLNQFSASGDVLPATKQGLIGDAYSEKGDLDQALSYYNKAVRSTDNEFITPMYLKKVGLLNEKNQKWKEAVDAYTKIKSNYPLSIDGNDIDKFIARVSAQL